MRNVSLFSSSGDVLRTFENVVRYSYGQVVFRQNSMIVSLGCDMQKGEYFSPQRAKPSINNDVDEVLDIIEGVNANGTNF